jgi:hypothetical protein
MPRIWKVEGIEMKNVEDIYPLSPVQQGMLFHSLSAPGSGVYVNQLRCDLEGALDSSSFERAWREVVERHPILRTAFIWEDVKESLQVVRQQVKLPWRKEDWRDLPEAERERRLEELVREERRRGFDESRAPLMRLVVIRTGEQVHCFVWTHHHLLLDGWSFSLVWRELFALYETFRRGEELPPSQRPPGYGSYIRSLQEQDEREATAFWRRMLEGVTAPTPIELPAAAPASRGGLGHRELRDSLAASSEALGQLGRRHRLTLNTLCLGAWAVLLSRYSGQSDVVFGVTVSGRPTSLPGVELMVGLFINTLPLRVQLDPAEPVTAWLERLQALLVELRQYEHSALVEVQKCSGVPGGSRCLRASSSSRTIRSTRAGRGSRKACRRSGSVSRRAPTIPSTSWCCPEGAPPCGSSMTHSASRLPP